MEAMESGKSIDRLFIKRDLGGELIKELIKMAAHYSVPVLKVPGEKLDRITKKNHQGVIAVISPVEYSNLENLIPYLYEEGKTPSCLVLDGLTDSRNFGAIARSAECAGVDFIVIPERGSVSVTSDAVRSSAGALFHIPVCRGSSMKEAVKILKANGYKIVGATEKGAVNYTEIDYQVPVAIVMGSEETGISSDVLKECDDLAKIPICGKIGSLNVSVAAGVMMYEMVRQRQIFGE